MFGNNENVETGKPFLVTKDNHELLESDDGWYTELIINRRRRSWWDRSFSRMDSGSLRGSIFTILAASIGVGVLTLPYICRMTGLLISFILTTFGMIVAFWGFHALIFSSEIFGSKRYLAICKAAGGNSLGYLYQTAIYIQQFGVILGCQIISGSMISQSCADFGLTQRIAFISSSWFDALKVIIPTVFISFPLCKQHNMTSLRYPSLIGVAAVIFAITLIIVHSFHAISFDRPFVWYRLDLNIFSACGITFFAYQCLSAFFPVYYDLANPTLSRISKVVFRSVAIEYVLYLIVAACGYLSFLDDTLPIIINNQAVTPLFQVLFNVARVMVYIKLAISIPINFNPLKRSVYDFIYGDSAELKEPQ